MWHQRQELNLHPVAVAITRSHFTYLPHQNHPSFTQRQDITMCDSFPALQLSLSLALLSLFLCWSL